MIEILPHSTMNSQDLDAESNYCWCLVINSRAWLRDRDPDCLPTNSICIILCFHIGSQALVFSIPPTISILNMAPGGCKPSHPPSV
jgi:hypothetical protein